MPLIAEWLPPERLKEWFFANPEALHAECPAHRKAVVFDARGERVSGRVRWINPKDGKVALLVKDADGFPVRDADGEELEEIVSARGWTFKRSHGGETIRIGNAS